MTGTNVAENAAETTRAAAPAASIGADALHGALTRLHGTVGGLLEHQDTHPGDVYRHLERLQRVHADVEDLLYPMTPPAIVDGAVPMFGHAVLAGDLLWCWGRWQIVTEVTPSQSAAHAIHALIRPADEDDIKPVEREFASDDVVVVRRGQS